MDFEYFDVIFNEDGSATAMGRVTARSTTNSNATGVNGEGYWLQQVDVSSITYKVFDEGVSTTVPSESGTVNIATSILDTPDETKTLWTKDEVGYNFIHDLDFSFFPTGDNYYRVEYEIIVNGGEKFHGVYRGKANSIYGS